VNHRGDLSAPNGLFRESDGTYAHAWPFSQALAAAISISTVTRSRVDVAEARRLVRLLPSYLDEGVYDATVSAPDGAGLQFFDDNEWLALDLVDAWHLLGDRSLLRRAERVFGWITSGWDGDSSHPCSGGVYWADTAAIRDRNTVTTANGAVLALELYQETGKPLYLTWGERMYSWVRSCLADDDGLLFDHLDRDGRVDRSKWAYNQGAMVAAASLLYRTTRASAYLSDATSVANRSLQYFDASGYARQPAIFVAIYFRYLRALDAVAAQPQIAAALSRYVARHETSAPGTGSDVLDRAAAVQLSAELARSGGERTGTGGMGNTSDEGGRS
jgi:mannose/cellobiose epimerase-like protein (N-acyl-D-glucosamine 2-epimerase family)